MENLIIKGTQTTPTVAFSIDGKLKIQGRMITDNPVTAFKPLFDWVDELQCSRIIFDIEIDYMNTSASMQLFSLLEKIESKKEFESVKVNWHYDEDDEDHLETGHFFEQKLDRTEFTYIKSPLTSKS